jgi:hypothetical protein
MRNVSESANPYYSPVTIRLDAGKVTVMVDRTILDHECEQRHVHFPAKYYHSGQMDFVSSHITGKMPPNPFTSTKGSEATSGDVRTKD